MTINVVDAFDITQQVMTGKNGNASRIFVINGRNITYEKRTIPERFPVYESLPAMLSALGRAQVKIYDIDSL